MNIIIPVLVKFFLKFDEDPIMLYQTMKIVDDHWVFLQIRVLRRI